MGTRGIMYAIDVKIMSRITPTIKGLQPADMTDGYCGYCREKLVDGDGSSKNNPSPFYFLPPQVFANAHNPFLLKKPRANK